MKAQTQTSRAKPKKADSISFLEVPDGYMLAMVKPTTAAKRKAAGKYLLDHMPKPVKKGEKGAAQLLAEYRIG